MPSASRLVYLDHATAAPLAPPVLEAMEPYLRQNYHSPASLSRKGREARQAVELARSQVAQLVGAPPASKVVFTSSACEANNLALFGYCRRNRRRGDRLVITSAGHNSQQRVADQLEREGFGVDRLAVDRTGRLDPAALEALLDERTLLVSLMVANDQTGTLQPLEEVREVLADHPGVRLHVDGRAAAGLLPLDMEAQGLDLVSLSSNALGGPGGMGALVLRPRLRLAPHLLGPDQEHGLRAGGENVPGIVGLGAAAGLALSELSTLAPRLLSLRRHLEQGLRSRLPDTLLHGHPGLRIPSMANLGFAGVEAEGLVLEMERRGISAAARSPCLSRSLAPSHVLQAMGVPPEQALTAVRFSLGRNNTTAQIEYVLDQLPPAVEKVRSLR